MDFSAGSLFASLAVSTIGFGIFSYGRKQTRAPQLVGGIALMVYPYFVGGSASILGVGAALLGGLWLAIRVGL